MRTDPKSAKRNWQLDLIFTLLGSGCVKAARKHVGEIDHWSLFKEISLDAALYLVNESMCK